MTNPTILTAGSYKGVILVGGPSVGTRFRPLSMDCPKPLFPVAGSPMIHHHVSSLAKVPGMREIFLIGFFENNVFDRFITEAQIEFPHVSIRYLREYQSMGTGGGIYHFRDEITRGNPDVFFVLNADIASSFPLVELLSFHRRHKSVATVMGIKVAKDKANKFGCLVVDPETDLVSHFVEKPSSYISDIVSCGIYAFSASEIFPLLSQAAERRRIADEEQGLVRAQFNGLGLNISGAPSSQLRGPERVQLEQDVLSFLVDRKLLYVFKASSYDFWLPIKTGSSLIPANRHYLQYFLLANPRRLSEPVTAATPFFKKLASPIIGSPAPVTSPGGTTRPHPEIIAPVSIHPTAIIHPTARIGPNVAIGPRALIGRGVRVKDSVILDNVEVKNDSCILNSIVGWDSKIGSWARLEGSRAEANSQTYLSDEKEAATQKGYKLPSAVILGKNVTVEDEIIIRNCIVLPHKELKSSFHNEILM